MLHEVPVAEVSILYGFVAEPGVLVVDGSQVGAAETGEDNWVVGGQVLEEPLASLHDFLRKTLLPVQVLQSLGAEVEDVPQYVDGHLPERQFHQVRVLDVEVLKDLDRQSAVIQGRGFLLEDASEGIHDEPDHELVLTGDIVPVLLVLFPEEPPVGPLANRYLLPLVQAHHRLH